MECTGRALQEVVGQLLQQAHRGKLGFDVEAWQGIRLHCDALVSFVGATNAAAGTTACDVADELLFD